jgi:hypothetical protein
MTATESLAPRRLRLSAGEYAYLVDRLELSMPPGWEPAPDERTGAELADLAKRGVLRGDGDMLAVHPSVAMNLRILAGPTVMLDTTATIGPAGLHSLHALAGSLGASLFALDEGALELSLFAAADLGRELIRAVPSEEDTEIGSALDDGHSAEPPRGDVRLAALRELGVAELLRGADPEAPAQVLRELRLPAEEAELATEVANRTDGALVSQITARVADEVRTARVAWLHTDSGWSGIRPAADRAMVALEPVARADLGVWAAPYVSEALSHG